MNKNLKVAFYCRVGTAKQLENKKSELDLHLEKTMKKLYKNFIDNRYSVIDKISNLNKIENNLVRSLKYEK